MQVNDCIYNIYSKYTGSYCSLSSVTVRAHAHQLTCSVNLPHAHWHYALSTAVKISTVRSMHSPLGMTYTGNTNIKQGDIIKHVNTMQHCPRKILEKGRFDRPLLTLNQKPY